MLWLEPTTGRVHLPHGPIPRTLLSQGIRWFGEILDRERYFGEILDRERYFLIRWQDGQHRYEIPQQVVSSAASLSYEPAEVHVAEVHVAEFHSHGGMRAFFSATDDRDEQGFRIYGVVGQLHQVTPRIALRLGSYGHFQELRLLEVFE